MTAKAKQPNGVVLYRGPSQLDGAPIVVIATGTARSSRNAKTGGEIQTWIIREDISPIDAVKSGADVSICGDCKHRGNGDGTNRSCYVTVFQAPLVVWKAYRKGLYPRVPLAELAHMLQGRVVRFGSYGDPAAAPIGIWSVLSRMVDGRVTGYTHQWRNASAELARFTMASCDNAAERDQAKANGWRTFRVMTPDEQLGAREISCPASKEAGAKTHCAECKACGGLDAKAKVDIAIVVHGAASKVNAFNGAARAA